MASARDLERLAPTFTGCSQRPEDHMPPPKSGKKLSPAQIELIKTWIEQGANWNSHWAFAAPLRPALPKVENPTWVRNSIDEFVLSRLEHEDGLREIQNRQTVGFDQNVTNPIDALVPKTGTLLQGKTLKGGLYPFIVGDLMKLLLAAMVLPGAWAVVDRVKGRKQGS